MSYDILIRRRAQKELAQLVKGDYERAKNPSEISRKTPDLQVVKN